MTAVREITSVNLRIAREIYGAADPLIRGYLADRLRGILLVGAPASGKTTLLRDLARQLADGAVGRYVKVCVVDESGEIGAASGGGIQNDLGVCSDLLSGYPKDRGLQIALRYLSPEVIICDEVGATGNRRNYRGRQQWCFGGDLYSCGKLCGIVAPSAGEETA